MFYPYEYFSGANVVLELEGIPAEEVAGVSFSINETKIPLYGYSSRHFDAVGRGKVLVRGSLIVNFVHKNYLYAVTQTGENVRGANEFVAPGNIDLDIGKADAELSKFLDNKEQREALIEAIFENPQAAAEYIPALQQKYWREGTNKFGQTLTDTLQTELVDVDFLNMHDLSKHLQIKITFGERALWNSYNGITGLLLSGVHFLGNGIPIQIDESVIVEEYQFIARNVHALKTPNRSSIVKDPTDF